METTLGEEKIIKARATFQLSEDLTGLVGKTMNKQS